MPLRAFLPAPLPEVLVLTSRLSFITCPIVAPTDNEVISGVILARPPIKEGNTFCTAGITVRCAT